MNGELEKPIYVYRTDETLEDAKFSIMDIKLNAWRIPINLYLFDHEIQNIKIFRKYETIPSMKVGDAVVVFFNNKISKKIFKSFEQKIIYNKKVALITLKTIYEIAALRYMKDILFRRNINIVEKGCIYFLKSGISQFSPDIPKEYIPIKYLSSLKAYYKTKITENKSDYFFQIHDILPQQYIFYSTYDKSLLDRSGINYFTYYHNPNTPIYIVADNQQNNKEIAKKMKMLSLDDIPYFEDFKKKCRYFITIQKNNDLNINTYLESDFINYTVGIPMQFAKEDAEDVFKQHYINYEMIQSTKKGFFYNISYEHPFSQYEINLLQKEMEKNHKAYCHCHVTIGKYESVVENNSNCLYANHQINLETISNSELLEKEKDFLFILPIEPSFILWQSKFIKFVFDNPIKDDKCMKELLDTFQDVFTLQQPTIS